MSSDIHMSGPVIAEASKMQPYKLSGQGCVN